MSLGTSNRDGGKTSESGHLRSLYKSFAGEVLSGLAVGQRGAGANMSVDIAIGDAIIPRSDSTYGHPSFNDAVLNQVLTPADGSNPRRDIVVMYINYGQAPSTAVSNNTNGVVLTKIVAGTPAGSPSDPTDAAIQSSVGSGNPFIKLARVRVGTGVTSLANAVIDDLRTIASALDNTGWEGLSSAWDYWVYASSTTITVPTNATDKYQVGQFIRLWQLTGGWKYAEIVSAASTLLTIQMATGTTLANERIYLPSYSYAHRPFGLPWSLPSNEVVQQVGTAYSAVATGTTSIPQDDTIPQNTEGDQYMTQVITPKSATSILIIEVDILIANNANNAKLAAIFQDSVANALAAKYVYLGTWTDPTFLVLRHVMVAGTTSPITFKVRGGASGAGTTTFNGANGSRLLGATSKSSIKVTEVRA